MRFARERAGMYVDNALACRAFDPLVSRWTWSTPASRELWAVRARTAGGLSCPELACMAGGRTEGRYQLASQLLLNLVCQNIIYVRKRQHETRLQQSEQKKLRPLLGL